MQPSHSSDELMLSIAVISERTALNSDPDSSIIPEDVMLEESEHSNTGSTRPDRTGQAKFEDDVTLAENLRQRQLIGTGKQGRVGREETVFSFSDTSYSAPAVQLEDAETVVPSVPERSCSLGKKVMCSRNLRR